MVRPIRSPATTSDAPRRRFFLPALGGRVIAALIGGHHLPTISAPTSTTAQQPQPHGRDVASRHRTVSGSGIPSPVQVSVNPNNNNNNNNNNEGTEPAALGGFPASPPRKRDDMETELPKPSSEVDLSRSFSRFHSALANRSCYQMDKDLYTTYADRQHWNVLQRRISGIQLRSDEVCAPQVFGRSGYRINISLSAESYAALKEGIVKIVRAHMQERQSIYEFDVSNAHALAAQIQALREAYDFLQSRRGRILECDLSTNDEKRYRDIVTPYLGEQVTVPSDDDLNLCSERLSAEIIAGACLLKGDQIQIQIPDGYQVPNIVDLCMAVDSFLRANGASIGEMTPAESRIGNSCLGFWQEFLEEDLHKARQEVCIAASKRINSREPHPTDLTIARHAMAQKEREHCSLFLALSDALRQPL